MSRHGFSRRGAGGVTAPPNATIPIRPPQTTHTRRYVLELADHTRKNATGGLSLSADVSEWRETLGIIALDSVYTETAGTIPR